MSDGCPVCGYEGEVAVTHDYDHEYFTHVRIHEGEVFRGSTCSRRTRPASPGLLTRLWRWLV